MDHERVSMRNLIYSAVVLTVLSAFTVFSQNPPRENWVKGELLVKFRDGVTSPSARAANRLIGAVAVEDLGDRKWQRVRLPEGLRVDQAINQYKNLANVEFVQPNFYYHLLTTPNDPLFTNSGMYGLTKISAPLAWDLTTGSSAVVVADIDTGMRITHSDLAGNLWVNTGEIPGNNVDDDGNGYIDDVNGWDFFFNDSSPADEHGHGTHTAGTIGAVGNNLIGITGVNWAVKIMPIKIYNSTGNGSTSAMLVNAYSYVRMMKLRGVDIRVTNNSYGGCDEACGYDQATKDGIDAMGEAGIINVFAAGNANSNNDALPSYPASYTSPSIIAVASSTSSDARSGFSNFGVMSVDLAAPGSGIYSTTFGSNTGYGTMSGTSMATPHVAGAAALLSALNPNLSPASLKATILNNVDLLGPWSGLVRTGGRLNVFSALQNQTACNFIVGNSVMQIPTKGGVFNVDLAPGQNCDYFVQSDSRWIHLMSQATVSGSSVLKFRVNVNPIINRSGKISIGDQELTIVQKRN